MIKAHKKHLIIGLLATTVLATPALAQDDPDTVFVPPVRRVVDDNGVNLSDGLMTVTGPGITIGSGTQGLSYQRTLNQSGTSVAWDNPYHYAVYGTAGTMLTVVTGGQSFEFNYDAATGLYVNEQGSGETLTGSGTSWTFKTRDGTVVQMDASDFDPAADQYNDIAIARTITFPNKQRLTLTYKHLTSYRAKFDAYIGHARIQSVQSSNGHMVKMEYANNGTTFDAGWINVAKVTLLNLAVDYCNPAADSCSFSQAWPSLTFTKDSATQIETVTDALNRITTYNMAAGLTAIRRPGSASDNVTITHDTSGKVTSLIRDGRTWTYSWSLAAPLMTATITNPDQTQQVIVTDTTIDQIKSAKDELNRTTLYDYDTQGRPTLITYPEGNKLKYTYDSRGNVTEKRVISKTPGTPPDIVISASYSAACANALTCNQPNSTTDARDNSTTFTYDPTHGGVLTVTSPAPTTGAVQPQTRYSYATRQAYFKNSAGSIVASGQATYLLTGTSTCQTQASCIGTADEVKTTVDYGPQAAGTGNNLLTVSVSKGAGNAALPVLQTNSYDWVGNVTYVDGSLPGNADVTRTIYDAGRQVVGQIGPDPDGGGPLPHRARRTSYNFAGQATRLERGTTTGQSDTNWASFAPAETIDVKYDSSGRLIEQKLSGSGGAVALTQTSYDSVGRPVCSAVRMNPAIYGSLPASACMLGTQGSFGPDQISRTVYDAAGQVTQVQTAVGTANQANEQTLNYTSNGKLQNIKDAENNLTAYVYDGFDRLSITYFPNPNKGSSDSNGSDFEQLTFDAAGNLYSRRLRSGETIEYRYDALNRLILKGGTPITDVSYGYDNLGRLLTAKFASAGLGITNSYDAFGRLTSSSSDVTGTAQASSYQYDVAGRRTRLTYPGSGLYVDYDYLVTGEMTKIRENGATSGIGVLATFAYDNLGRRASTAYGNGTNRNYAYDPVSRLAGLKIDVVGTSNDLVIGQVATEGTPIIYNPALQITSVPRSNDAFAYLGSYNVNRPYTSNGLNQYMTAGSATFTYGDGRGNLTSDGTVNYAYSPENRLINTSGALTSSLSYDPLLRLYQVVSSPTTTRFAYDGLDVIAEFDGSNLVLRRYVHGPRMDEPLVQYEGSGTADRRFLAADERGSIVAVSDSSGNLLAGNSYDEYGIPAATNTGRFQYTGQMWLPEVGLYYYKNRMYSPTSGRFLQTDPIGYGDGMNMYAYAKNDPVNWADADGLRALTIGEQVLLGEAFGGLLNLDKWTINEATGLDRSVAWGWGPIGITTKRWSDDYFLEGSRSPQRNTFYHEFYHALEYTVGLVKFLDLAALQTKHWVIEKLGGSVPDMYNYRSEQLKDLAFMDLPAEARAQYFGDCMTGRNQCDRMLDGGLSFSYGGVDYSFVRLSNGQLGIAVTAIVTGSRIPITRIYPVKIK